MCRLLEDELKVSILINTGLHYLSIKLDLDGKTDHFIVDFDH